MNEKFISKYDDISFGISEEQKLSDEELMEYMELKTHLNNNQIKELRSNRKKITQTIKDSIIGFAIGDAIGVPLEFLPRNKYKTYETDDMLEYGSHYQPKGTWSDDTSMVLATTDSILEKGAIDYNDIADNFCNWLYNAENTATGVVYDIGNTTRKALYNYSGIRENAEKCGEMGEENSGNGSLMRILPVAMYCYFDKSHSKEEKREIIKNVSSITHANETCKLGCVIYSEFIGFLLQGYAKETAYSLLQQQDYSNDFATEIIEKYDYILKENISELTDETINSSGYIVDTLEATMWSIMTTNNFKDSIIKSINLGDDTDTIAALTGGMAGIIYPTDQIPKKWYDNIKKIDILENKSEQLGITLKNINQKKTILKK